MSGKLAIMAGLAVVFGTTSYYAGNEYLESQTQARLNQLEAGKQPGIELASIVVATQTLRFGQVLSDDHLKMVSWPADALPEGAFTSIEDAIANGERKVLKSIEANEPVLARKLTGENGRAGLAGIIADGMRAVTIPVDHVKGVGGFVMPGDRVDIIFTQRDRKTGEQSAKIIMEKVKVLSVDQDADTRGNGPKIAKTVTLETDTDGAKRLALAGDVGRLSLLLRGAGDEETVGTSDFSVGGEAIADRGIEGGDDPEARKEEKNEDKGFLSFLTEKEAPREKTIRIVRGEKVKEAVVPVQQQIEKQPVQ